MPHHFRTLLASFVTLALAGGTVAARADDRSHLDVTRVRSAGVVHPDPAPSEPAPAPQAAPVASEPRVQAVASALSGRDACLVVRRDGRTIAEHAADRPLTTASTQKLLVAAAALRNLGPDHRFTTTARSATAPVDGTVADIWLVGGGDPMLATPEYSAYLPTNLRWKDHVPTSLAALSDGLVAAGVRTVQGRIQADDSRHEGVRMLPGWKAGYVSAGTVSSLSALSVNGGWASWQPSRSAHPDPSLNAASELTRLLRARGVHVANDAGRGVSPPTAPLLAEVRSAPLVQVLAGVLRASDNTATEMIVRELGVHATGAGTTEAGIQAVGSSLEAGGVDVQGLALADGSGLHPGNRATCRTIADTLDLAPGGVDLATLLAVAGRTGTLWRRFVGTPLEGRLAGKTGWINGVVGLAGRIDGRTTFAILQNGVPSLDAGRQTEERLLHDLTAAA